MPTPAIDTARKPVTRALTSPESWSRDSRLLDEALALEATERGRWLEQLRAADPEAAATLVALLASHAEAEASGFLATPPARPPLAVKDAATAGMACGAYRLVEPIGVGGMGMVWRGERADGHFQRAVAIKLLHADAVSPALRARLQREAAVLTRLAHPHIAALIDAGVADNGQPYLVLELVEGQRIDAACRAQRLPLSRRLALMLELLDAVAHAHARLVVHRDLKPANVLLSADGACVKLLDFGIAGLVDPMAGMPGEPGAVRAAASLRALTPRYAAPEQLAGGEITTATDLYGLGSVLRELLADLPMPADSRADLDAIVARSTAADPAARYATAQAMAEDLRRHLQHKPVRARANRWPHVALRFVRRHRSWVLAAALAATALGATAGVALWQREEARSQRDEALSRQRAAEAVRHFAGQMMALSGSDGRPLNAEEVTDHAEALARRLYAEQPAVLADLLMLVASKNTVLQRRPARERNYADAAALALQSGDAPLVALTRCFAQPMDDPGSARQVAALAHSVPVRDPRFARARHHCHSFAATLMAWDGRATEAEAHAAASEAALAELGPSQLLLQADVHETRGDVARARGDVARAEAHYAAALRADATMAGPGIATLQTAQRLNYRMLMQLQMGLPRQALASSDELLSLLGGMNTVRDLPAYMHSNRGVALMQLGHVDEAEATLRHAIARAEQTGSRLYLNSAQARLAELLLDRGRDLEAAPLVHAVTAYAAEHASAANTATALLSQARLLHAEGRHGEAADHSTRAAAAASANAFVKPLLGQAELMRARAELAAGRNAEAALAARRALRHSQALAGTAASPGTLHTGRAALVLAQALRRTDPAAAQREAQAAATALAHALGPAQAEAAGARERAASYRP